MQGDLPGKQLAGLDWVSEGSATSSDGTDIQTQSAASSDDEADSVNSQLHCILKGRLQRLGSTAMGWSYYAAGAAFGTLLGLKQGILKSYERAQTDASGRTLYDVRQKYKSAAHFKSVPMPHVRVAKVNMQFQGLCS